MDRDRLLHLLDAYLEGSLSAADRADLNAALLASAEARTLFWEYAHQHALLTDLLAEERGRRLARQELAPLATVAAPARLPLTPYLAALAALVLVSVGLAFLLYQQPGSAPVDPVDSVAARLQELQGEVVVIGAQQRPARPGQVVRPGEVIRTGQGSSAVVAYADSSRLELNAETAVRLLEAGSRAGKAIFLLEGVLSAIVAPQPAGRPLRLSTVQADLLAAGSRFSSASVSGETRIEVEAGKALLSRKGDTRPVEMRSGAWAVAAPELEVFGPTPLLPAGGMPAATLEEGTGPVLALAALDRGRALAVGCSSGLVKIYDVRRRRLRTVLNAGRKRTLALAAAPDGRTLAVGYDAQAKKDLNESVLIWDTHRRRIQHVLPGTRRGHALAFAPDGRTLTLASAGRGLLVWDLPAPGPQRSHAGRERLVLGDRDTRVRTLTLSPDGRTVAAGCVDGRVRLYDTDSGRPAGTLEGHTRDVQAVTFRPGGAVLATGGRDGTVRLWSMPAGEPLGELKGKFGEVRCLAFSPDGQTLVSGHAGLAVLWDVTTGQTRATLKAHRFAVTALAYLENGRMLATAGWDRCVKLWDLFPMGGRPL